MQMLWFGSQARGFKLGYEACFVVLLRRMLAERYVLFAAVSFRAVRSLNIQALTFPLEALIQY